MLRDLSNQKFGRLKVIERAENTKAGKARWLCRCDCGNKTVVTGSKLTNGHTKSCGCLLLDKSTKHGRSHHPLYSVWMKQRCSNPNASRYERYGGRGIQVCNEWQDDFQCFYDDMIGGYQDGLQLDRVDNEQGYCKENCRWVTPATNVKNRETTIYYGGMCLKDYCEKNGLQYERVFQRIHYYHWPIEAALTNKKFRGKRGMKDDRN